MADINDNTSNIKRYYNDKHQLHSFDDQPAEIIYDENTMNSSNPIIIKQSWYKDGLLHRDNDKPAVINNKCGLSRWYKDGLLHREGDNPAEIICSKYSWYKDGLLHRDNDKPAIINTEFGVYTEKWYIKGQLHRDNDRYAWKVGNPETGFEYKWYVYDILYKCSEKISHIRRIFNWQHPNSTKNNKN